MIEMGARQYDPVVGRFLELDPVDGGGANDYLYPVDPLQMSDLNGNFWSWSDIKKFGKNAVKRTYQAARFVRNTASGASTFGLVYYAMVTGAKCRFNTDQLMFACSGAKRLTFRGGTTIGNVFGTPKAKVKPLLMQHEAKHADQWSLLGLGFGGMYLGAEAHRKVIGGSPACNIFEQLAGARAGDYKKPCRISM